jgi:hypothetical protein
MLFSTSFRIELFCKRRYEIKHWNDKLVCFLFVSPLKDYKSGWEKEILSDICVEDSILFKCMLASSSMTGSMARMKCNLESSLTWNGVVTQYKFILFSSFS